MLHCNEQSTSHPPCAPTAPCFAGDSEFSTAGTLRGPGKCWRKRRSSCSPSPEPRLGERSPGFCASSSAPSARSLTARSVVARALAKGNRRGHPHPRGGCCRRDRAERINRNVPVFRSEREAPAAAPTLAGPMAEPRRVRSPSTGHHSGSQPNNG